MQLHASPSKLVKYPLNQQLYLQEAIACAALSCALRALSITLFSAVIQFA